jgi:hypothetical protein
MPQAAAAVPVEPQARSSVAREALRRALVVEDRRAAAAMARRE